MSQPEVTLVATLARPPAEDGSDLRRLSGEVDWLEVRADLTGELDPEWLRQHFAGRLLYTLRSTAEGGRFEGSSQRRRDRLKRAVQAYDLIDLEAERDSSAALLSAVPPDKRLLSWHGSATGLSDLRRRFEELAQTPARLYKLVPTAVQSGDEIVPLGLLHSLGRRDVVAFAAGTLGAWTRLLAPRLGSAWMYGSAVDEGVAPGQPSIRQLKADYGLPDLPRVERLFGVVGNPVSHSLSPRLHNGAYRALGLPLLYLPFHLQRFGDFWMEVVESGSLEALGFPLVGLSVTSPFKEVALAVAGAASPLAERIEAANTLVLRDGVWEAETTDGEGVVVALERRGVSLRGRRVAVVGCGGAGRSAAVGLALSGCDVTLVNRTEERGHRAARSLGVPFVPLAEFDPLSYEIVINATPVGGRDGDGLPFQVEKLAPGTSVVDLVYGEAPTALQRRAAERGALTVDGREVLLAQALGQFQLMTGYQLPEPLGRRLLGLGEA